MKIKVLLVEDDPNLGDILCEYLQLKDYEARLARDGQEGSQLFQHNPYDICILDLMLPKKDGFTLAKEIRNIDKQIPIIFLTAKSMNEDIINGFTLGGDDYITKPFSMEVLRHRINAVMKRVSQKNIEILPNPSKIGKFIYFHEDAKLSTPTRQIKLTTKENKLLKLFFENLGQTVARSVALEKIWKNDNYFNARTMDVYISKLRRYFAEDSSIKIQTIHKEGFKLMQLQ